MTPLVEFGSFEDDIFMYFGELVKPLERHVDLVFVFTDAGRAEDVFCLISHTVEQDADLSLLVLSGQTGH